MKFTEDQRYAIIEAVYNHVGDEYDKDEHGNAALKLDSQDIKLLSRLESILSPLPHQDSASAEDVLKEVPCVQIGLDSFFGWQSTVKAMHQFAQSEVDKIVAEKDREIQKLYDKISMDSEIYEIQEDVISATNSKVSLLESQLSAANEKITHLEQGMANWVRVSDERQFRINELEEQNKKYYFMIEHGLGIEDMMPPTYPHP